MTQQKDGSWLIGLNCHCHTALQIRNILESTRHIKSYINKVHQQLRDEYF